MGDKFNKCSTEVIKQMRRIQNQYWFCIRLHTDNRGRQMINHLIYTVLRLFISTAHGKDKISKMGINPKLPAIFT